MLNLDLAKKIKSLRIKNALTQEELADATHLSLRTIQRIEAGETEPRSDTLKRLANALKVTPNDLIDWIEHENLSYIALINLSALSFIFFPLFGLVFPLILWILKRDKIKNIEEIGKKIINFQLMWCILVFLTFVSTISGISIWNYNGTNYDVSSYFTSFLYAYNLILIIVNTSLCYNGKTPFYKPAFPILR